MSQLEESNLEWAREMYERLIEESKGTDREIRLMNPNVMNFFLLYWQMGLMPKGRRSIRLAAEEYGINNRKAQSWSEKFQFTTIAKEMDQEFAVRQTESVHSKTLANVSTLLERTIEGLLHVDIDGISDRIDDAYKLQAQLSNLKALTDIHKRHAPKEEVSTESGRFPKSITIDFGMGEEELEDEE